MAASIDSGEKTVEEDDIVGGDDEAAPPRRSPVSHAMNSELKIVVDVVEAKKELDLVPSSLQLSLARHIISLECEATVTEQIKCNRAFFNGDSEIELPQLHQDDGQDFVEMSEYGEEVTWTTDLVSESNYRSLRITAASRNEQSTTRRSSHRIFTVLIHADVELGIAWLTGDVGGGADSFRLC
ncbi:hypothetical protein Bca4012_024050 [Brassica carinata]